MASEYVHTHNVSTDKYVKSDNFANRLDGLMSANDLTQVKLAEKVGVSQSTVSDWLKGTLPDGAKLLKLSEALGASIDYLLKGMAGIKHPEVRERYAEEPDDWERATYKRRMEAAEKLLADVREGLRKLLAATADTPLPEQKPKPSSSPTSPEGYDGAAVVAEEVNRQRAESPTPFLTGGHKSGASRSYPRSGPQSKTPRPAPPKPGKA